MANNILDSYISKVIVNQQTKNNDVVKISTEYLSPEGDVYTLDTEAISPSVIQTTTSINELEPEVSNVYPYKSVTSIDFDGSTILLTPTVDRIVTSSQNYYAPVYFERYKKEVLTSIDKNFYELILPTTGSSEGE